MTPAAPIVSIVLPIRTVSLTNQREHHFARSRRAKEQINTTILLLRQYGVPELPVRVHLVRISTGRLDAHDNLRSALKSVVDGIAKWLGVDDRDPRVEWTYDQEKPKGDDRRLKLGWIPPSMRMSVRVEVSR